MTLGIEDAVTAALARMPQVRPDGSWDDSLARSVAETLCAEGWSGVGLAEELGGEGGALTDAVAVAAAVVGHGWPSPIPDILLVSNVVLAVTGLPTRAELRSGVMLPTAGMLDASGRLTVQAHHVAWAPWAERFLVVAEQRPGDEAHLAVVDAKRAGMRQARSLDGTPVADVAMDGVVIDEIFPVDVPTGDLIEVMRTAGALCRSLQSLSALEIVRDMSIDHIRTRRQFGRPLSAFQAVQQHVAMLVGEVAAASAAVSACLSSVDGDLGVGAVASLVHSPGHATAKIRTSISAAEVARIAHQLHGAIGIAREHELHRHTLALLTWREEFGDEYHWAARLAADLGDSLDVWAWVTDRR
jgi:alkylation response protein AidB-like acyl-CoA dehydrogenase